ncbi:MAG: hypothetical protein HKP35_05765 [Silicimonas sp.]|nr:hypothetical protein [Silicimonas sp.]
MKLILATLLTTAALAGPASAFIAKNGLIVEPSGTNRFEVPYRGLSGTSDFWCAAGEYVVRRLNMPPSTRIYRVSRPPRRSGQGIAFSLSSEGATRTGLLLLSGRSSVTASHARLLCDVPNLTAD